MKKQKPLDKPKSEMTEQERIDDWRRRRAQKGSINRPGGKVMGKVKREVKSE